MHEWSIAQSILDLARTHVPAGSRLSAVRVSVGPMRGIDPQSLQAAFDALTSTDASQALRPDSRRGTAVLRAAPDLLNVRLDLVELPWPMSCDDCRRTWTSHDLDSHCACGSLRVRPTGGDDLELLSIEIDTLVPSRSAS